MVAGGGAQRSHRLESHSGSAVPVDPIARLIILLEASMGPISSNGSNIGQGNFVEAKAMLKKAGSAMAASQRMVFHFSRCFFSAHFMGCVWFW